MAIAGQKIWHWAAWFATFT